MPRPSVALKRSLPFWLLVLYGLGTTVGAGIYVLVGKVAGAAGMQAPLAFLVAALLAGTAALAFAELAGRYPLSAGEAAYVDAAFGRSWLTLLVGLAVIAAGLVSAATITLGFAGYLRAFVEVPPPFAVTGVVVLLGLLAAWGIAESAMIAAIVTLAEVAALMAVIVAGAPALAGLPPLLPEILLPSGSAALGGILAGAVLAFYAFIGFEDMVNVAEEVRDAPRVLPRAILAVLGITTLLYLGVALVAVLVMAPERLAASEAPLSAVYAAAGGRGAAVIDLVAIFSVLNGALIQLIMASRVLYGLAQRGGLPSWLGRVHPRTRTPVLATALVSAICLALALLFPIVTLARLTAHVALAVFAVVNLALWCLKGRGDAAPGGFVLPRWVPAAGFAACLAMLAADLLWPV
ncbi:APC family permease [Marinibaculum pumilum]|uniref:APC family permease n=1 Tax=Marinibaculum pumilum TaxID=1766165 RepID=A0ABV7KZN2_9PROT